MYYDVIVIGTGPSGLFVAQHLSANGINTLLLEKNKQLGKKLLISGSGQCNFTHSGPIEDFLDKYGEHKKFIKHALLNFDNKSVLKFFKNLNVDYEITSNGKVFPKSRNSQDILDALVTANKLNGTTIQSGINIKDVVKYDNLYSLLDENGQSYCCTNLVIATGGCSYPHLGTTGWGHEVAKQFGHKIVEPRPALTNIITVEKPYQELSGVSFNNITMTIWRDNKKIKDRIGTLLFTHKGISGPVVLDACRWIQPNDKLTFNLLNLSYEEIEDMLEKDFLSHGKEQLSTYLKKFNLPKSFLSLMFTILEINHSQKCAQVNKKTRKSLAKYLTSLPLTVNKLGNLKSAMVTAGGVYLKEINPVSFESRKSKKLYFIGEVIDIDGDTGGYNIQAAFSMAYVCANNIIAER